MNRLIRTGVAVIAAAAAVALAACSGSGGGVAGGGGGGGEAATTTLTLASDSDSAASGYDPLLYSQGQFTFFSSLYDALFVTPPTARSAQPGHRIHEQRGEHRDHADAARRRHLRRRFHAQRRAGQAKPRPPQRHRAGGLRLPRPGGASEITEVTAPDAKTVVITWAKPQATPENNLVDTPASSLGRRVSPIRVRWRPRRTAPAPTP